MMMFNRFDRLSTRNLLYMQSEFAALQRQQEELDRDDFFDTRTESKSIARDWEAFESAATIKKSKAAKRMALVKKIRRKVKEYSKHP